MLSRGYSRIILSKMQAFALPHERSPLIRKLDRIRHAHYGIISKGNSQECILLLKVRSLRL